MGVKVRVIDVTPMDYERLVASYLVLGEKTALIDVGGESTSSYLIDEVKSVAGGLDYIIPTHVHLDHGGATGSVARAFNGARVIAHPRAVRHLRDPRELWERSRALLGSIADVYGEPLPVPPGRLYPAPDELEIDLGGDRLVVIHTPGHASHHMSLYLRGEGIMFSGDSAGVVVDDGGDVLELPTNPPPFKPKLYLESLEKMLSRSPKKLAVAHYGIYEDAVDYLARHKSQVIEWLNAISEIVSRGVRDLGGISKELEDTIPTARRASSSKNQLITMFFYLGALMGLSDAVMKGEWP